MGYRDCPMHGSLHYRQKKTFGKSPPITKAVQQEILASVRRSAVSMRKVGPSQRNLQTNTLKINFNGDPVSLMPSPHCPNRSVNHSSMKKAPSILSLDEHSSPMMSVTRPVCTFPDQKVFNNVRDVSLTPPSSSSKGNVRTSVEYPRSRLGPQRHRSKTWFFGVHLRP